MSFDVPGITNRADIISLFLAFVAVTVIGRGVAAFLTGSAAPTQPVSAPDGLGSAAWAVLLGVAHLLVAVAVNSEPYHLLFDEDAHRLGAQAVALFVLLMIGLLVSA